MGDDGVQIGVERSAQVINVTFALLCSSIRCRVRTFTPAMTVESCQLTVTTSPRRTTPPEMTSA